MLAGVKGLAPVFLGLVFGRGLGGCRQAENRLQSGKGVGGQSGVQVAGQSGVFIGQLPSIRCSGFIEPLQRAARPLATRWVLVIVNLIEFISGVT